MNTKTPTTLRPLHGYIARVTRETLSLLQSDYSDSGYMNIHGSDIIIDLCLIDDCRDDFAEHLGINVDDLPQDGVILIHA